VNLDLGLLAKYQLLRTYTERNPGHGCGFVTDPSEQGMSYLREVKRENAIGVWQRSLGKLGMTESVREPSS